MSLTRKFKSPSLNHFFLQIIDSLGINHKMQFLQKYRVLNMAGAQDYRHDNTVRHSKVNPFKSSLIPLNSFFEVVASITHSL